MNYCSIEDAWKESNTFSNQKNIIEKFDNNQTNNNLSDQTNNQSNQSNQTNNLSNQTNNNNLPNQTNNNNNLTISNCDCDKLIDYVLKCTDCHDKLLNILNKNKYYSIINNLISIIQRNRDSIIIILVSLFILLLLNLLNNIFNIIFN